MSQPERSEVLQVPVIRVPVSLTWPASGSPGVSVFHLRTTDAVGTPGFDLIVDEALDVLNTWYTYVANNLCVQGFTWSMGASLVEEGTDVAFDATVRGGTNGGSTSAAPQALAIVVGWRTSSASRRGRGRTFIGPLAANVMDSNGTPNNTILSGLNTATSTFVTDSQAIAGGAFCVWGQESAGLPFPKVGRDITSHKVRDTFAVLRSRRD